MTLKAAAEGAGVKYGASSDTPIAKAPEPYQQLVALNCDILAVGMAWTGVSATPGVIEWRREDPNIAFARQHGMQLTGAHLLWYLRSPQWLSGMTAGPTAQQAVQQYVHDICSHYAGQVYSWNVLNECLDTRRSDKDNLRQTVFDEKLGSGYMEEAFHTARAADPHALLAYNDAGYEANTPRAQAQRDALMHLLDRLQRNAPIDAVGMQSHLVLDDTQFDPELYRRFLASIASRGLKVLITELDVLDKRGGPEFQARDADVARRYTDFLTVALEEPAVKSVVTWGLSDRYTWLTPDRDGPFHRPDKLPARPLPFDDQFVPKPAYTAILDAFRHAPKRTQA